MAVLRSSALLWIGAIVGAQPPPPACVPLCDLYVADMGTLQVTKVAHCTGTRTVIAPGVFGAPWGVAVHNDDVYVADGSAGQVWLVKNGTGTPTQIAGSVAPAALLVDDNGTTLYVSSDQNKVWKRDLASGAWSTVGSGFNAPRGLAMHPASGDLYVADWKNNRVVVTPGGSGNPVPVGGGYDQPLGVAVNAGHDVYVADGYNNRVRLYRNGSSDAIDLGPFGAPTDVKVSPANDLYVLDYSSGTVKFVAGGSNTSRSVAVAFGYRQPYSLALGQCSS